jgi:hypothetical protein
MYVPQTTPPGLHPQSRSTAVAPSPRLKAQAANHDGPVDIILNVGTSFSARWEPLGALSSYTASIAQPTPWPGANRKSKSNTRLPRRHHGGEDGLTRHGSALVCSVPTPTGRLASCRAGSSCQRVRIPSTLERSKTLAAMPRGAPPRSASIAGKLCFFLARCNQFGGHTRRTSCEGCRRTRMYLLPR